ncbi:PIN-like domain-containing protein [Priestia endophytica]|uniref:PIN-like domain-containing protein n=1 Tax=Priestia endophytica TaxID=135735 RepID=UPI0018CC8CA4|nr:PIN-like domain-containing protein [Priestia endophytica]
MDYFKGFTGYSDDEFEELWKKAIFVVDTNILINFYKYTSKQSTKSLLDILKKVKEANRLWIPHQVALEYFFNYEDNMFKQKEGYNQLSRELAKLKDEAQKTLSTVKSKHPYIITEKFQFMVDSIEKSNKIVEKQINQEIENLPDSNAIQEDILKLLDGIIGDPYSQKKINEIEKDGAERYKHDIPPGFKDKTDNNKKAYRTYGDFKYQQLYGDLIVWHQIMDRAKIEDNPKPIILITEDRKEDWWEKDGSHIKRPHPQLIQEFLNKTQQKFYMYRTDSFVRYAIDYLGVEVSEEQAQEVTNEIENIRKSEETEQSDKTRVRKRYVEQNINKDLIKNFNVKKLMGFLTEEEQEHFRVLVGQAFTNNGDLEQSDITYDGAISWAIYRSFNKLEYKFNELIGKLALSDYDKVQSYVPIISSIPENNQLEKGILLLKYIEEVEEALKQIEFLENLPF